MCDAAQTNGSRSVTVGKCYATRPMKPFAQNNNARASSTLPGPQWRTEMFEGPIYRGGVSFSADVNSAGVLLCRLVYAGPKRTETIAHASLTDRARKWIKAYEARSPKSV